MKHLHLTLLMSPLLFMGSCATGQGGEIDALSVDELAVAVSPDENREYSYTDKKSGYWYGRTHQDNFDDWFAGWNIAMRRIFSDYTLAVDGKPLSRKEASEVTVAPDCLSRRWEVAFERLQMVDEKEILSIAVTDVKGDSIAISIDERLLKNAVAGGDALCYTPIESDTNIIKIVPAVPQPARFDGRWLTTPASAGGFLIAFGTESRCDSLIAQFRQEGDRLHAERKERMNRLLADNTPLHTNLPELDRSLAWITLTMDQLITDQQGRGIYAGLPWFNSYWGRDMFIAMPGAALVTGQFDCAEEILADFAKLQDCNPESPTYGRIPNLATPDSIIYNTTDGTPRYVMEAYELLQYTGDRGFLEDVYPAIVRSIDQCIAHSIDEKGYLLHADADTWMDVKRNGIAGSPRGNRANDIQYLWHSQLLAGSRMATLMGDDTHAAKWQAVADTLAQNFEKDYCDKEGILIYDHLNADGSPDLQYRPNQLFCFDLISDDMFKQRVTRRVWEQLVYPWGVSSLEQHDPQFHPQHENWEHYHKDDAYHNGTVWLWNNGIAMQRMIEYGQVETAWKLFCNMNRQALREGAVGSLSENADAHPRPGKAWAGRSGTFLQAWSNSEQLRVWYQCFLGIRPDLMNGVVEVKPCLPAEITDLDASVKLGGGKLIYRYHGGKFDVSLQGIDAKLVVVEPAKPEPTGSRIFDGVDFCQPDTTIDFPCMKQYYKQ